MNYKKLDHDATEALKTLLEEGSTAIQKQLGDWTTEQINEKQALFYKGKNYIPQDEELRRDITRMFHDHETAGHLYRMGRQRGSLPFIGNFLRKQPDLCLSGRIY